ncbi:MAG: hypothetical protein IOD12_17390 [Silvanigrellales bacterium]|nr:hypothetical protein [Silvanigrellales bacterium]
MRIPNTSPRIATSVATLYAAFAPVLILASMGFTFAPMAAQAHQRDSIYTHIELDDPETHVREGNCLNLEYMLDEAGYRKDLCGTVGGVSLFVRSGDARDWISFQRVDSPEHEVYLPDVHAGAFTFLPAKVVEWRGTKTPGKFVPDALIVRSRSETWSPELTFVSERLSVVRIETNRVCLIGSIDTLKVRDANVQARALADSNLSCE